MATYTVNVIETRAYYIDYTVEADTPEEALEKALEGDTVSEDEANKQLSGVQDRHAELEDVREIEACPVCGETGYSSPDECSFCQNQEDT